MANKIEKLLHSWSLHHGSWGLETVSFPDVPPLTLWPMPLDAQEWGLSPLPTHSFQLTCFAHLQNIEEGFNNHGPSPRDHPSP